jgi:hypothetical protein
MRLRNLYQPTFLYEVPGGAASGGAPPVAQPAAPTPQPAQGQGQGQGDGFRSTFFPNVPDEHWQLIEPHIGGVNRHVTQLQQRYAPFNSYTPEAVQGLARFAEAFEQNPTAQWIVMARALQQNGQLDPDLDLDHLESLINGQQQAEATSPVGEIEGVPPQIAEMLQQQQQVIQQLQERLDKGDLTQRQSIEDQALKRTMGWMKSQLKKAGVNEELLTDQRLMGMFISHGGNPQAAIQDAIDYRTALLGGVVPDPKQQSQKQELKLDNGVPPVKTAGVRKPSGGNRRGMFAKVSTAAEQSLARANQ